MSELVFEISMSLDGFVAGPDATLEEPLGENGERLHEWVVRLEAWRRSHGHEGGETTPSTPVMEEALERTGAVIMGRRMFSGGEGPWADDPNPDAWWGDEPPFHVPVFVLTHHEREPVEKQGGTTFHFVTDGIESALEQARAVAGDRDVGLGGGANVAQQYLAAGLLDEINLNLVPTLLGDGVRLFEGHGTATDALECTRVIEAPGVTHLRYRVAR